MSNAASILERLAEATWDRLDLSHTLKCPQSEETITDTNLLELARRQPAGLRVYKARGRDEPEKGFDFECYVETAGGGWWRYSVQAKKLDLASNRYSRFRHVVGGRFQIDILRDFARKNKTIPLYCLYNAKPASVEQLYWHCNLPFKAKQLGCSVVPLAVAQQVHRPLVRRSFEAAHGHERSLPWRCLVRCPLLCGAFRAGHHPLLPDGHDVEPLTELPAYLREVPEGAETVELPDEGYASEFGGLPRWIVIVPFDRRSLEPDYELSLLDRLKELGVSDPNVDLFRAAARGDTALLTLALGAGADVDIQLREVLNRHRATIQKDDVSARLLAALLVLYARQ